jgi:poly-gamma-glutamate synthase PgsB/CapB
MIHALLRCRGMDVFGKTTGSAARLLMPDGTEKSIKRFGPANIREQRNILIKAAFRGKRALAEKRQNRALVFECNAVQEELQYISAKWLKPDITVITNVREDHAFDLGTVEEAAQIFAAALPDNSALVTSDGNFMDTWKAAARKKNLRLCYVDPCEAKKEAEKHAGNYAFPENAACVLAIADCLKIDRAQAPASSAAYKPDAGAFAIYSWKDGSRDIFFADARAANDIESTNNLYAVTQQTIKPLTSVRRILLLINREDRPDRTELFMRYIIEQHKGLCFDDYLCLGHVPLSFRITMKRQGVNCRILRGKKDFDSVLAETGEQALCFFVAGNFGGKGKQVTLWLQAKRRQADFKVLL